MIEKFGNIWEFGRYSSCVAITTNGCVTKEGKCVMGRGIALQAREMFPGIDRILGQKIKRFGNIPIAIGQFNFRGNKEHCRPNKYRIFSFPTKHNWREKSDIKLIEQSARILGALFTRVWGHETMYLVRPGCNNGGLDWETEVKPVIDPLLDSHFIIVEREK